ncbi:uncharacterized protein SOCE26_074430 [Sorangium cellulosum]|uniref:Transposase IS4-like domain-containing protein n=1 Tax=Sorangium cellulosum TaxID=56 RepID=A0A2L0F362_SORCE|nr:uncharacterized protein SOCE26_074430 [Sorangium cellulosum]
MRHSPATRGTASRVPGAAGVCASVAAAMGTAGKRRGRAGPGRRSPRALEELPALARGALLDPVAYAANELAALYHERWELELADDEPKTDMLDRRESIRSKTPAMVRQEIWGLLLAYNLVRLEIERVAAEARVPPTRISFIWRCVSSATRRPWRPRTPRAPRASARRRSWR